LSPAKDNAAAVNGTSEKKTVDVRYTVFDNAEGLIASREIVPRMVATKDMALLFLIPHLTTNVTLLAVLSLSRSSNSTVIMKKMP
jgi:hypothetical protein